MIVLLVMLALLPVTSGDCPRHCYCSRYKMRCFLAKLYHLPPDIVNTTEELTIERDNITELTRAINHLVLMTDIRLIYTNTSIIVPLAFRGMDQLRTIVISHNRIKKIAPGTFVGLHKLSKIDLSYNSIEIVGGHMFKGLHALRYLDLSHNNISTLPVGLFEGIGNSCIIANGRLDLSDNQISHIEPGTFRNLCSFTELDLSENNLAVVPEGTFRGLTRLKALDLSKCNITKVSVDSFLGLDNLDSLKLDGSLFTRFGDGKQAKMENIRYLYLSSGQIDTIVQHTFTNFTLLKELNLYSNAIRNLSCGAFHNLESLLLLDLSFNKLSTLSSCMFESLKSLKTLSLNNNQIAVLHNYTFRHLEKLESLDLSFNNLSVLTDNMFPNLTHLKTLFLLNNQISKMHSNSFLNLTSLTSLVLPGNLFTELQDGLFRNLTRLNNLDLTQNANLTILPGALGDLKTMLNLGLQLNYNDTITLVTGLHGLIRGIINIQHLKLTGIKTSLQPDEFKGIQLETLDLSDNNITVLLEENFRELTMLKSLFLHSSSIQKINVAAFRKLRHLIELKLSNNFLENLEPGVFAGLQSLEKLELNNNRIKSVKKGVFGPLCVNKELLHMCSNTRFEPQEVSNCVVNPFLVQLRHLLLNNNTIAYIHLHAFIHSSKLQTLDLSNNPITTLHFLLIPSLEKLVLTSCNISSVPVQNFSCISNLIELHINQNNITTLEMEALKPLNRLKYIDISNNPFVCDCRFEETVRWMKRIRHEENIQCADENEPWHFSLADMLCHISLTEQSESRSFSVNNILLITKQMEPVILLIIFVVGMVGNGFVLFLFARHSELRTMYNAHLLNLAICDFMFLIMNIPLTYWNFYSITWDLGLFTCKAFMSMRDLTTAAAIYALVHWSFQRYNAIMPSFWMTHLIDENKLMWLCLLVVWGISLGAAFPVLLTATVKDKCFYSTPDNGFIKQTWNIHLVAFCIIPLLLITVLNARVSLHLTRSVQHCDDENQAKIRVRISKVLWIQTTVFCISYFPNFLLRVLFALSVIDRDSVSDTMVFLYFISFCLFFISSCFNPVALLWMSIKFQEVSVSHFECCRRRNFNFVSVGERISVRERLGQFTQNCRLRLQRLSNEDVHLESLT